MTEFKSNALALARWEKNSKFWLRGDFAELRSKETTLQELVGDGGTLWIVVSRRRKGRRLYSLTFKLVDCRPCNYKTAVEFGRYAIKGNRDSSSYFPSNDATLLLMSMRFDPRGAGPIKSVDVIGNSLQKPRVLRPDDVKLLDKYASRNSRWSAFLSYATKDGASAARRVVAGLEKSGISTFGDEERLIVGENFERKIKEAIEGARYFILLVSPESARSNWVAKEREWARSKSTPPITVPIILKGGRLEDFPGLETIQALTWASPAGATVEKLVSQLKALQFATVD
jgi:hypothetical protein